MLDLSKRLGLCLGIAASFCFGACDDDSGSDKGKTSSGSDEVTCEADEDCKDVEGKPKCDVKKNECVAESDEGGKDDETNKDDGKCKSDSDCKEAGKPKCDTESGECKADEGTGDDTGDQTDTGDGKCKYDSDCTEAGKPKCDVASGECKADESQEIEVVEKKCDEGRTPCGDDDKCVDLMSDNENCNVCGNDCTKENKVCKMGVCVKECDAGKTLCGNDCLDLSSDTSCGTCEKHEPCDTANNYHCSPSNTCEPPCPDADKPDQCGELCVNFKTDAKYCGGCGDDKTCPDGQVCNNGTCAKECGENEVFFDDNCISKNDPKHCGIGSDSRDEEIPEGGIDCTALPGVVETTCEEGKCKISKCEDNYAVCESNPHVCTDLRSKDACGSCTNQCNDENADADKTVCKVNSESLTSSVCQYTCKEGMESCGGKCLNLQEDKDNCGWCGNKCGSNETCQNGFCTIDASECEHDSGDVPNGYVKTTVDDQDIYAYCIKTEADFIAMRDALNAGKKYPDANNVNNAFIIMDDLVLGEEAKWVPVKTFDKGYFLGNGKEISGKLTITNSTSGLFGTVSNSVLSGFNLKIDIDAGPYVQVGALAGSANSSKIMFSKEEGTLTNKNVNTSDRLGGFVGIASSSTFSNLSAKVKITFDGIHSVAGITGQISGTTKFLYCNADVDMKATYPGNDYIRVDGGIYGWNSSGNWTIDHCHTSGKMDLTGLKQRGRGFGGLAGGPTQNDGQKGVISNSSSTMEIICDKATECGGLMGSMWSTSGTTTVTISDSYATGNVSGYNYIGGLVGYTGKTKMTISDSYATGKVTGSYQYTGGLLGASDNTTLTNCYATGEVNGAAFVGGLIGTASSSTMNNVYATGNVTSKVGVLNPGYNVATDTLTGGLIGNMVNSTVNGAWATGIVKGGGYIGGLAGRMQSGQLDNAAAFGSATCLSSGTSIGNYAGGLVGCGTDGFVINDSFATGNSKGGSSVGTVIGHVARGNVTLKNTYGTGKVNGNEDTAGGLVGYISAGTVALKNSYYWENAGPDKGVMKGTPTSDSSVSSFKYNDNKDAVLTKNEKRKLVDSLGSNWVAIQCKVTGGPEETMTIPVPKALSADICK